MSIQRFLKSCLILLVTVSMGCMSNQGSVQHEKLGHVYFTGNVENAVVFIDELPSFELDSKAGDGGYHFQMSSGKHTIIVKKSGTIVVNRQVLIGSGTTKEIRIP